MGWGYILDNRAWYYKKTYLQNSVLKSPLLPCKIGTFCARNGLNIMSVYPQILLNPRDSIPSLATEDFIQKLIFPWGISIPDNGAVSILLFFNFLFLLPSLLHVIIPRKTPPLYKTSCVIYLWPQDAVAEKAVSGKWGFCPYRNKFPCFLILFLDISHKKAPPTSQI